VVVATAATMVVQAQTIARPVVQGRADCPGKASAEEVVMMVAAPAFGESYSPVAALKKLPDFPGSHNC